MTVPPQQSGDQFGQQSGRQSVEQSVEPSVPAAGVQTAPPVGLPTGFPAALALRLMTMADIDAVLELEHALFGEEAWSRQMLTGELREQPASRHYLIADAGGVVAGYAGLLAAGQQADVVTLAVAAGHWGHGIGSALLTALLTEAARRGAAEVFLEVRTDNVRAQRLYHRNGFAEIGIRKGYYQPSGTDALVMRREQPGTGQPATGLLGTGRPGTGRQGMGRQGTDRPGAGRQGMEP